MFETQVEECTAEDTLSSVEVLHHHRVAAEAAILRHAAHFADLHNGDARTATGRVLPGMEQAKHYGGPGTPAVLEFAAAEFGARLQMHPITAGNLFADALDLRHRHPLMWDQVCTGQVRAWKAQKLAQATRPLRAEQAGFVDTAVTPYVSSLPWARFEALVTAKIIEADPDAAEAHRKAAEAEQFVSTGRANEHGLKTLIAQAHAGDVIYFLAMVNRIAEALAAFGDTTLVGVRRAKAVGILANPTRALQLLHDYANHVATAHQATAHQATTDGPDPDPRTPGDLDQAEQHQDEEDDVEVSESDVHPSQNDAEDPPPVPHPCPTCNGTGTGDPAAFTRPTRVDPATLLPPATLYLHLHQDAFTRDANGVARFEGHGPITATQAREYLGAGCQVTIKPVIDLANMAPVDAYEIPDRLREALHLRNPADVFPYATSLSHRTDIDHTHPYLAPDNGGPPGQTRMGNLGPLTRRHHRIKTFSRWRCSQPTPGVYLWTDPHGHRYQVDHTGTHTLGPTPARSVTEAGPRLQLAPAQVLLEYQRVHAA